MGNPFRWSIRLAALCASGLAAGDAGSVVSTYTERASFLAAVAGRTVETQGFDGLTAGTTIPSGTSVGSIEFDYLLIDDFGEPIDLDIVVTCGIQNCVGENAIDTTSPPNSLGLEGDDQAFLDVTVFRLIFPEANAVGLYVLGADLLPGDFALDAAGSSAVSGAPDVTLSNNKAFFLGIVESDPGATFTQAEVRSFLPLAALLFFWNVDDVTIATPEPGSIAQGTATLAALALVAAGRARLRRTDRPSVRARGAIRPSGAPPARGRRWWWD